MLLPRFVCWLGMLLIALSAAAPLRAENKGQEDLDKATEVRLSTRSLRDPDEILQHLSEVIRLTESALKKGLDDPGRQFAEKLLSSTRMQRGILMTESIFNRIPPHPRWADLRQGALNDLQAAVKFDPQQPQAWLAIARLNLLPDGDRKQAKEAIDQAIRTAADNPNLHARALLLRAGLEKDVEKRLPDLNEAVRLAPDDPEVLRNRGMVLVQLQKYDEALADLDKALEKAPENAGLYFIKAAVLEQMKKYDEALAALDQVVRRAPKAAAPLLQKAQIHLLQKKPDAALEDLTKAYDLDVTNVDILLRRSAVYLEMGEKEKAFKDAEEAFRWRPYNPQVTRFKAALLLSMGKTDEALKLLEELQKRNPQDPQILLQRAAILMLKKQTARAIPLYSDFLREHPKEPSVLGARGDAYLNVGKHAEAIADYEKAYALEPKDSALLNNFAWVLATSPVDKLRDGKRALELATRACELTDYKRPHILSTLAAAYAETGDFDNARKWSAKAVEIGDPEHDADLKKELESYQADKPVRELKTEEEKPASESPASVAETPPSPEKPPVVETPSPAEKTSPPVAEKPPAAPAPPSSPTIEPFNGKNLEGWTVKEPRDHSYWTVGIAAIDPADPAALKVSPAEDKPGELINAKEGGEDIYSNEKFGDCTIDLELMIPKGSNSGVYVMGEYEIQVFDSYGKENIGPGDMGSIYGAAVAKVNAAKPPGQWQTLHIEFQAPRFQGDKKTANARFLKVLLNEQLIHENLEMDHQTPGGITGHEVPEGPLMFQGNHGPVAYRNIKITPAKK